MTCWETFSGGEIPYPGIRPSAITRYLESGQRLEKPNNKACTDEVLVLSVRITHDQSSF